MKPRGTDKQHDGEVEARGEVLDAVAASATEASARRDSLEDFFVRAEERQGIELSFASPGATARAGRDMVELLAFWVADEEYALPIVEIQEIIKLPVITEVPRTPSAVMGIISLRGTIVPVLDLRQVLRLDARVETRQSRILVLRANGDPVGLLVDRVTSVVRLDNEAIEATPRAMLRQENELLRGVGRLGGRLIIILDINAVLGVLQSAA